MKLKDVNTPVKVAKPVSGGATRNFNECLETGGKANTEYIMFCEDV